MKRIEENDFASLNKETEPNPGIVTIVNWAGNCRRGQRKQSSCYLANSMYNLFEGDLGKKNQKPENPMEKMSVSMQERYVHGSTSVVYRKEVGMICMQVL